jgi:formate hydrogenlyase subunit 4
MQNVLDVLIHLLLTLLLPPLLPGVINRTKAFFAGRAGPPLLQPYYDLLKLWRKQMVFSKTATWVFRAGPVVGLATAALAALLVPLGNHAAPFSFPGDLVLLLYLFALGRFFTTSAALDTGSPFEGMGAAREATFACLAEPAFFFGLVVLARLSNSLSLGPMFDGALAVPGAARASLVLVVASWFVVLLAENTRVPFDDPNTHLELTMIHEVMVLDHSGPGFGMILYGAALKLFVYGALVLRLALPVSTGVSLLDWPLFVGGLLLLAVSVGVVESVMARLRLVHVPILLVAACLLSAFGFVLLLR